MALLFVPTVAVMGMLFYLCWHNQFSLANVRLYMQENVDWLKAMMPWIILGSLLGGIIAHELLHGLTWARFTSNGINSIRFGFIWKALTPYCHCTEALPIKAYRLGVAMPGIALGILPLVVAFLAGHVGLFLFGIMFTIAAGGDFAILYLIRQEKSNMMVLDHPHKIGCIIFSPAQ
ncbi:DUF3267 domain-containing protein [Pseudochryseolinea flava]|nr:DUF3267 domain-containing protein [Pseudochryseolinea flava]